MLINNFAPVQKCVEIISKSKRPVMVLGSQSVLKSDLVGCLASSMEVYSLIAIFVVFLRVFIYINYSFQSLGIPCFLGGMSRGLLGQNSTIQFRHCRKIALKESDCIILAGAAIRYP